MTVTAPRTPERLEPEQGVIEEARRHRRRRRRARRAATAAVVVAAVAIGAALALGSGSPRSRPSLRRDPRQPAFAMPSSVAQALRDLIVLPATSAGYAGLCEHEFTGGASCGADYGEADRPLFGDSGFAVYPHGRVPRGGMYYFVLAAPGVASVRVSGVGDVPAVADPGRVPDGDRVAVFHLPGGTVGTVIPPGASPSLLAGSEQLKGTPAITMTPLDTSARPMHQLSEESLTAAKGQWTRYWQRPTPPPKGVCAVSMATLTVVTPRFGVISTALRQQPRLEGPAFLSCLDTYYSTPGSGVFVSVFLNAQHPGLRPSPLWGTPVPGHPGLLEVGGPRTRPEPDGGFVSQMTARREGDAWLAVQGGSGLAQRVRILAALRLTRSP